MTFSNSFGRPIRDAVYDHLLITKMSKFEELVDRLIMITKNHPQVESSSLILEDLERIQFIDTRDIYYKISELVLEFGNINVSGNLNDEFINHQRDVFLYKCELIRGSAFRYDATRFIYSGTPLVSLVDNWDLVPLIPKVSDLVGEWDTRLIVPRDNYNDPYPEHTLKSLRTSERLIKMLGDFSKSNRIAEVFLEDVGSSWMETVHSDLTNLIIYLSETLRKHESLHPEAYFIYCNVVESLEPLVDEVSSTYVEEFIYCLKCSSVLHSIDNSSVVKEFKDLRLNNLVIDSKCIGN